MDILGTVLSAAQTLFAALQCPELKETLSIFGYKSQLDDLLRTVETIKTVLLDAEAKQELCREERHWIEELKDVIFEADDLMDEFVTLAERKQLVESGGSLSTKVSRFFTDSNPFGVAYRMSQGVKKIKKKLDSIAYNCQFSFKLDPEPMRRISRETCSYVNAPDVIGRELDLEKIVGILLDSNVQRDVSFLPIVGMGGLGKTTLAQLVYNDDRVRNAFSLKSWTCVSDQDQKQLDVKEILCKILGEGHEGSTLEKVQSQLRKKLEDKRYLLVLDDVWTESTYQWDSLAAYLTGGHRGSWVVVTTRSQETARIVGDGLVHKLKGLSKEHSWSLFEKMAFGSLQSNQQHNDLVKIGREIVDKCAQVPLAIRVVGSLLNGQGKSKWLSYLKIGLASIREDQNDIMPILKLSYYYLESPLKCCFSYCAVFPKNFIINKKMLIDLWIAQGYIVPLYVGQSIEEVSEEYVAILLNRCFFQGSGGDCVTIHDLMHDIAKEVIGKELCTTTAMGDNLDKRVRHLSLARSKFARYTFGKTHIRSYFYASYWHHDADVGQFSVEALLPNCLRLRSLDLAGSKIKVLPDSIGGLLHLRYLDISFNDYLEVLPKSITLLCNLQTLKLDNCKRLKELPKKLSRLIKLRTLGIYGCENLTCMPRGIGKLTGLHTLSNFIVGGEESFSSWKEWFHSLEDLKALNNLKGNLRIQLKWPKITTDAVKDIRREGLYLRNKEHLSYILVDFKCEEDGGRVDNEEARRLMEDLQPHTNLKDLTVRKYQGSRMPGWVTLLPNLVHLCLFDCRELEYLSCLGNLQHLKDLQLRKLPKLEYIVENRLLVNSSCWPRSGLAGVSLFFPALERLDFKDMPKFKGWRRGEWVGDDLQLLEDSSQFSLPQLKSLKVERCLFLTCIPSCPMLEDLHLFEFSNSLQIANFKRDENPCSSSSWTSTDPENSRISFPVPKLKTVSINNVAWLNVLPMEAFRYLTILSIVKDEVEILGEVVEVFRSCSSSLRTLFIDRCFKLRSVSGGLEHLNALKHLSIRDTPKLSLSEEREDGMPWRSLHYSLSYLEFFNLRQLVDLPNWMQFLSALQTLTLVHCNQLESMPSWTSKLTSLRKLSISYCSANLVKRCQNPFGEDWPNIQHIPSIEITCTAPNILFLPLW